MRTHALQKIYQNDICICKILQCRTQHDLLPMTYLEIPSQQKTKSINNAKRKNVLQHPQTVVAIND